MSLQLTLSLTSGRGRSWAGWTAAGAAGIAGSSSCWSSTLYRPPLCHCSILLCLDDLGNTINPEETGQILDYRCQISLPFHIRIHKETRTESISLHACKHTTLTKSFSLSPLGSVLFSILQLWGQLLLLLQLRQPVYIVWETSLLIGYCSAH